MSELDQRLESAIAIHRQGRVEEAEAVYREVVTSHPDHAEAHHMLGVARLQRGDPVAAEAEIVRALELAPDTPKFLNNLGNALMALERMADAAAAFERAVELDPTFAGAAFNLATTVMQLGQLQRAVAILTDLARATPLNPDVFVNLVTALLRNGQLEEARQWCRRGLRRHRDHAILLGSQANILELANKVAEAEPIARKAVEMGPGVNWNRMILARILRRAKKYDDALAAIDVLLESNPTDVDRAGACYERGQILDRVGDAHAAFAAFAEANRLFAETPDAKLCDGKALLHKVHRYGEWFTGPRLEALAKQAIGGAAKAPVFFVGFPRSGTTLMEQVLRAHPRLTAIEERSPLAAVEAALVAEGGELPEVLEACDDSRFAALRSLYWNEAEAMLGGLGGKVLIDKVPLNLVELGVINAIFPSARIIVALRDPRDVCLSCFMQRFRVNDAMVNFLDIERTAETYAAVMGLWRHYDGVLTMPRMTYRYEDLIADFDSTVREVLDFIGVGWHDDVAAYREKAGERHIKTPSYRDVTSGLYTRAIGRWQAYADDLEPMFGHLSPFIHAFGYGDS